LGLTWKDAVLAYLNPVQIFVGMTKNVNLNDKTSVRFRTRDLSDASYSLAVVTSRVVYQGTALRVCVLKVPRSDLGRYKLYVEGLRGFPQSVHGNAR
jgi:hypothetical protein